MVIFGTETTKEIMDKRNYILPIITSSMLIALVFPTLIYVIIPFAVIMIYAVNLHCKNVKANSDQPQSFETHKAEHEDKLLQH